MITLEELVVSLLDAVPPAVGGVGDAVQIVVDQISMTLPVELRFGAGGGIEASAPRGRYATGFALPHHLLSVDFTTLGPAE